MFKINELSVGKEYYCMNHPLIDPDIPLMITGVESIPGWKGQVAFVTFVYKDLPREAILRDQDEMPLIFVPAPQMGELKLKK